MKKFILLVFIIILTAGCSKNLNSFRTIDTTDVIPTKEQIKEQLAAEKAKEKQYLATKTGYPDTTKPVKPEPVKVASTTPVTNPVVVASATKKPVREIVIYPDDDVPQPVVIVPAASPAITIIASQAVSIPTVVEPVAETVIYRVMVGKFPTKEAAEPLLSEMKESYKTAFIKKAEGKEEYSVQIAASTKEKSAKDIEAKLKKQGYKVFVVEAKK